MIKNLRFKILGRDTVHFGRETHPRGARQTESHWQHWLHTKGSADASKFEISTLNFCLLDKLQIYLWQLR